MRKLSLIISKRLTVVLFASLYLCQFSFAEIFNQEKYKTHLRWNFNVNKEQILISKTYKTVKIETLDIDLYENVLKELANVNLNSEYFSKINYSKTDFPAKPATVEIALKDEAVELFSFYKDTDKKYILDFWVNTDLITAKNAAIAKTDEAPKEAKKAPVANPDTQDTTIMRPAKLPSLAQSREKTKNASGTDLAQSNGDLSSEGPYRDFRYGAALIWNYDALIPTMDKMINLESKTPDTFYPIADREFDKDDKEAHMQLTINLFNKGKWGLMSKSINLYSQKYGTDKNFELNEFLKANALLKNNLKEKNKSIMNSASNILKNIFERTENYELKSAIAKYLLEYNLQQNENVQTLNLAKKLYVASKGAFDNETALYAANIILFTLAKLGQVDQIDSFVSDLSVKKLLPPQLAMAYKSYTYLSLGQTTELIKEYEKNEKSLTNPKHPAILYNVAESYFRTSQYEKALKVYDEFLKDHSYIDVSSNARLRMALSYDLLGKPIDEVLNLYKNAINRSVNPAIRYEAKIRYVGVRVNRKKVLDDLDKETIVFLEHSDEERSMINGDLKKLLWVVRLRTFLNTKFYQEALTYLTSLPLDSLKPVEKRLFEADGAEIIFGLINDHYVKEDYAKAIKLWETFRDKYVDKVALNPSINFVVCHSYIKLGLNHSYDRTLESFKNLKSSELQTFPLWVERTKNTSVKNLLNELTILKFLNVADWVNAEGKLNELVAAGEGGAKISYYRGLIQFNLKKYKESADSFEKLLVVEEGGKLLSAPELSTVTTAYLESLYNLGQNDKFKSVAKALLVDLSKSQSPLVVQSTERVNYLLIEAISGEAKPDYKELESLTEKFTNKFKSSQYRGRVHYLLGTTLIKNEKLQDGEKILRNLIKDVSIPGYIRELSKTELSTLELRRRSL